MISLSSRAGHPVRGTRGVRLVGGAIVGLLCLGEAACADPGQTGGETTRTVHVSVDGSDTASGSTGAPFRTITTALKRTRTGDTIVVGTGEYHESLKIEGRGGRTLEAAPGARVTLDGSRPVTSWTRSGSVWISDGWTARFDHSPSFTKGVPDGTRPGWRFLNRRYPMAAHPDQLWIGGTPQRQVATRSQVVPGTFFVDETRSRLVIGSNPSGTQVRASDLGKAISIRESGVTVDGIDVRRYANSVPTMGAITIDAPFSGATLRNMVVSQNAATGVFVGGPKATLTDVTVDSNGMQGLMATRADDLSIDRLTTRDNNTEHFNYAPVAGGARFGRMSRLTIRDSVFSGNRGTGLWLDESVYDSSIYSSRMIGNAAHGISLEISGTSKVADNVIVGNAADGIKINDTDNVEVWNNTILRNGRSIDIAQDNRDRNPDGSFLDTRLPLSYRTAHITVRNNILGRQARPAPCLLCVADHTRRFGATGLKITTDANLYQQGPVATRPWLVLWSTRKGAPAPYSSLPALARATGMEKRGTRIPAKPSPVTADYRTTAAVDALAPSTAVTVPAWLSASLGVSTVPPKLGAWTR